MIIKRCGCGASFTRRQFFCLERLVFRAWPGGLLLAFATCACGSTLATVVSDEAPPSSQPAPPSAQQR